MSKDRHLPLDELVYLSKERIREHKDPRLPYIGLEHMAQGKPFLIDTALSSASVSTNCVFEPGDILFGKLRPNLKKSLRVDFPGYCSTDILVLRVREGFHPEFVAKVFQSNKVFQAAVQTSVGTRMPRTSWGDLKQLSVPVPPLPEQRRIAEILDAADEAIRRTERVIAKLREVKKGLLHDLLTRGLDADGNLRDPDAHPEQFKDSPLGRIPREWSVKTTSEICSSVADGTHNTPKPSEEGYPLITSKNLKNGRISWEDAYLISEEDYQSVIQRSWVEEGDILFSMIGTLGNVVMLSEEESNIATKNVGILRFNKDFVKASWVLRVLQSDHIERQINTALGGSTQKFIALGTLRSFLNPVPARRGEMRAISRVLDAHDARIRAEEATLHKLRQVKRGLMDDLLTGRVRVG